MIKHNKKSFQYILIKISVRLSIFYYKYSPKWWLNNWPRIRDLFIIRLYGFKPIGYCDNYAGEYTFIFNTDEEAELAANKLEWRNNKKSLVVGWWYGKDEFLMEYNKVDNIYKSKIKWL